ncbi:MAG: transglycosylase SLT domain-containing protein [Bdellovibrionales bacterium]|jgi:membrane-bound lytic murein transglycosylase D|nr:transglycosylase SLT domain-containing protein [Bdellovibrionales bacterium]
MIILVRPLLLILILLISSCSLWPWGSKQKKEKVEVVEISAEEQEELDRFKWIDHDSKRPMEVLLSEANILTPGRKKNLLSEKNLVEELKIEGINLESTMKVRKWIKYFTKENPTSFQQMINKGEPLRLVMQNILADKGLPKELYYLPLIESGYDSNAKSSASAIGAWQFIKGTGKRYGLHIDKNIDERKDPIRATEAAAKYLRSLYNVFQSWDLALAAYNTGEHRVLKAIMKTGTRSFESLSYRKAIPYETRNYVPKLKAAIIIARNLKKYGFKISNTEKFPSLDAVAVPGGIAVTELSRITGVSIDLIRKYNPHLSKGIIPSISKYYEIWVPKTHKMQVLSKKTDLSSLESSKKNSEKYGSIKLNDKYYYLVKRGDTLSSIARYFNESIAYIKEINGLSNNKIKIGQKLRISSKSYNASKVRFFLPAYLGN